MSRVSIALRASTAGKWMECAAKQELLESLARDPDEPLHVGAHVGNLVHQALTGHDPGHPASILYDDVTRSEREAHRHADMLTAGMRSKIDELPFEITETEVWMKETFEADDTRIIVSGQADMVGLDGDNAVLIDLKTGKSEPQSAWMQLAIYASLWHAARNEPLKSCGVIWGRRGTSSVAYEERDGRTLEETGHAIIRGMINIARTGALPSPSVFACRTCPKTDCAVRFGVHPK